MPSDCNFFHEIAVPIFGHPSVANEVEIYPAQGMALYNIKTYFFLIQGDVVYWLLKVYNICMVVCGLL